MRARHRIEVGSGNGRVSERAAIVLRVRVRVSVNNKFGAEGGRRVIPLQFRGGLDQSQPEWCALGRQE